MFRRLNLVKAGGETISKQIEDKGIKDRISKKSHMVYQWVMESDDPIKVIECSDNNDLNESIADSSPGCSDISSVITRID